MAIDKKGAAGAVKSPVPVKKSYYCPTCQRTMDANQFYTSKRLDVYTAEGKLHECKKCLTRHVDNYDPETYLWILEAVDVPYIRKEWDRLLEKAQEKDPTKISGMTILGKYLSKMKLRQWGEYSWDDSEKLEEENEENLVISMRQRGYDDETIKEMVAEESKPIERPELELNEDGGEVVSFFQQPSYFEDDLEEDDKKYLSLKWGRNYSSEDWVRLEKLYVEIMDSYDIQTATHLDYLILICKCSLKANKLIDIDDIEGSQKILRTYDTLMKSARFTAQQDKDDHGDGVDSIGEIVAVCEKDGFIPKFYENNPRDRVDDVLKDFKLYVSKLIENEPDLVAQIERAVKTMSADDSKKDLADGEMADEDLFADNVMNVDDDDFMEHFRLLEDETELDYDLDEED